MMRVGGVFFWGVGLYMNYFFSNFDFLRIVFALFVAVRPGGME